MSALTRFFFTPVYAPRSGWTVVIWWESRRAIFNLSVGAAGALSLAALSLSAMLPPHPAAFQVPLRVILLYAVMANLCYSLGPVIDVALHKKFGAAYAPVGPALFRYGFAFSVGLTLLPVPLAALSWLARVLGLLG
jgi:hypothetical protein